MRRELVALAVLGGLFLAGCSQLERLTLIRPSAQHRGYTQIAPRYDVSGKHGQDSGDAAMLLATGTLFYQRGELDRAEDQARKALKAQPGSGDANTLLGLVADVRGDAAAAGKHFQAAAASAPANGVYANNYGSWLCANARAAESLAWFDQALADPTYPTPVRALANAGECARKAGQPARAEASWRAALALDAADVQALAGLAALELSQGKYLEARAFAERWLAVAPDDAAALQLAIQVEEKTGDNVAASRYRSRLQAIFPGPTTAPRAQ